MIFIFLATENLDSDDRNFIESLYQKHIGMMVLTIRAYTTDLEPRDIIQDAVLRMIKYIDTLRSLEDKAQLQYIIAIVRSVTIKELEKQNLAFRKEYTGDFAETMMNVAADLTNQPEKVLETREKQRQLKSVLLQLPEKDQLLLFYRYYARCGLKEIAETMGLKKNQLSTLIQRARQKALVLLQKEGQAHDEK